MVTAEKKVRKNIYTTFPGSVRLEKMLAAVGYPKRHISPKSADTIAHSVMKRFFGGHECRHCGQNRTAHPSREKRSANIPKACEPLSSRDDNPATIPI